jgi:hypothetical protein
VGERWSAGTQPINEIGSGHESRNSQAIRLGANPFAFALRAIPAASANALRLTGNKRNPDVQKASKSFHAACACLALISPFRTLMDKALENPFTIQSDDTNGPVQDSNQASICGLAGSGTNVGTAALMSR